MLLEDSIQNKKKTWKSNVVRDHEGNVFRTIPDMCRHWGISPSCYRERLARHFTLEQILTYRPDFTSTDHLGNTYRTKSEMCNHYGVMIGTYNSRINRGWSVEKALTGKESTNNE